MRALSFGAVAAAYERYRLGYPGGLVDDVLAYAGRPVRTALEIGAGTGKATRVFAARGIAVTATDPDAAMLAELAKHVPATVRTVQATFEQLDLGTSYDLVLAAASLHWTNPVGRWERVAALLPSEGTFATFGCEFELSDPVLRAAVEDARRPFLESDDFPSPDGTPADSETKWPATELLRSALFTDVRQTVIPRRTTVSAAGYLGLLSTISAYLVLPEEVRDDAFRHIGQVLPERVELTADLILHLARRTTVPITAGEAAPGTMAG
jgi:SAM-dependent methyltransferase